MITNLFLFFFYSLFQLLTSLKQNSQKRIKLYWKNPKKRKIHFFTFVFFCSIAKKRFLSDIVFEFWEKSNTSERKIFRWEKKMIYQVTKKLKEKKISHSLNLNLLTKFLWVEMKKLILIFSPKISGLNCKKKKQKMRNFPIE